MGKVLKIAAVLAVLGIVAVIAGILISADSGSDFFSDQEYVKVEDSIEVGSLTTIVLDMKNRKIIVGESGTGKIELSYYESEKDPIEGTTEGTTYTLENKPVWYFGFLGWMNMQNWFTDDRTTVYLNVPAGTEWVLRLGSENGDISLTDLGPLSDLTLNTENGDITLDGLDVGILSADTENGGVNLTDLTCSSADLRTTNGRIRLLHVASGAIQVHDVNGDITLNDVEALSIEGTNTNGRYDFTDVVVSGAIDVSTTNGNIEMIRITTSDLSCLTTNGSIDVSLYGVYENYRAYFQSVTGSVTVDGESEGEGTHHESMTDSVSLRTTSGSIDLDFLP